MPETENVRDAIIECFRAHNGGPLATREVRTWIEQHFPGRWKAVSTALADLTIGGNTSSLYRDSDKCLIRVSHGVYRLADAYRSAAMEPRRLSDRPSITRPRTLPAQDHLYRRRRARPNSGWQAALQHMRPRLKSPGASFLNEPYQKLRAAMNIVA